MFKGSIFQPKRNSIWLVYPHEFKAKVSPQLEAISPSYGGTFHHNIKFFLTIGQIFALMPIKGISGSTSASLGFSFITLRMLYTLLIMTASSAMAVITFYHSITWTHFKFNNVVLLIWFIINTLVMGEYIRVGRKWPTLMKHWEAVELSVTVRDINTHALFRKLILWSSICVPILAGTEHLLSLANNFDELHSCNITEDLISAYLRHSFPSYYAFFRVNYVSGVFLQLLNLICTVTWNFTDNFIVVVSLGLITQFRHFNVQFERYKGMYLPDDFWGRQRTYYNKLMNLIGHVNRDLATIIIVSYLNNLFFICLQLFYSVTPSRSVIRRVYFWYSLIYLIGRTILVSLTAAFINEEAKKPIKILHSIPSSVYRSENIHLVINVTCMYQSLQVCAVHFLYIRRVSGRKLCPLHYFAHVFFTMYRMCIEFSPVFMILPTTFLHFVHIYFANFALFRPFRLCKSKRFMEQVSNNTIALSGMQFFSITRKFMLSIAGTIITYEVVLIQLKHLQEDAIVQCEG